MKRISLLACGAAIALPGMALANCPAITLTDMQGVAGGAHGQQYDLAEFEAAAGCTLEISENPAIGDFNARIRGNSGLPPVAERVPADALVVVPYDSIGSYGGVLNTLANAPESGTADILSVRHVNLVRYADDLQTIVPNVAKSWSWNDDFTVLTVDLREGHKWSDGAPFTSADVIFWYDNIQMDTNVFESPKGYALVGGERMNLEADGPNRVIFNLPSPKPGLLAFFATTHVPPFLPKHFLGQFHPEVDANADANAQTLGFENGYEAIKAYYGNSDWTDTPTPMLSMPDRAGGLPRDAMPTIESHIYVKDTTENRVAVANPYFFMVDTAGNQLPYIPEIDEIYVSDTEVRILKLVNGEADYKSQALQLDAAPILLENQEGGNYTVDLRPQVAYSVFGFNFNHEDLEKRKVFGDLRFREAMSVAINRAELNEVAFLGLGQPLQYTGFSPLPSFVDDKWLSHKAEYDPASAAEMLDDIGMVDTDGDGFRELPNGDTLVLNLSFSSQKVSPAVVELVSKYWQDVGIKVGAKEVTSDEYRSAQSANKLDVVSWQMGQPIAAILGNGSRFVPPYGGYFSARVAMLWGEWVESAGASGVEPPEWSKQIMADIDAFQSAQVGSPVSVEIGNRLVATMTENLVFIGTVQAPGPIYHRNVLKNFPDYLAQSDEFRWAFPYRPQQWFLDE